MPTIGIPRSLLYFYYHPAWKGFFRGLGAKIKVSPKSDDTLLQRGIENSVSDLCVPFKIFHGHILSLADEVDYIFLPRVMSVMKKEYLCPKFLGLPDLIRNSELKLPPLITPTINFVRNQASIYKSIWATGGFITKNPKTLKKASVAAKYEMECHNKELLKGTIFIDGDNPVKNPEDYLIRIGLIGHSYLVMDSHISKNIITFLCNKKIKVITADNVSLNDISKGLVNCPKDIFWTYNKRLWGAGNYLSTHKKIDGLIHISSFGCGPDSILKDLLQRRVNVPFLSINIDEHTGQAGLETRLEAFLDLLRRWRKVSEKSDLSSFGESFNSYRDLNSIIEPGSCNASADK